ncbi:MAG: type II toxin-antitoxin system RelB/DinJ family antitoxin [Lachnospiraceae bacterium]|nr:type II toxin-antitoxin system RelB/DinJ family antitoxin [Lachnospiraceae bacterium]
MADTTITFRTDEKLKKEASRLYESMGMSLSTALNMFMRQSVAKKKFPCSIEAEISGDYSYTYPEGFFDMFGADTFSGMEIPGELSFSGDSERMEL